MEAPIRFKVNREKTREALVYIAHRWRQEHPNEKMPIWRILKVLFYADKKHLQDYIRPVTGDAPHALPKGPVPSFAYDLIKKHSPLDAETLAWGREALNVDHNTDEEWADVRARRAPNLALLSESDRECLDWATDTIGPMPFGELDAKSHAEPAYKAAPRNGEMPTELLIEPDAPNRDGLIEHLRETASTTVL